MISMCVSAILKSMKDVEIVEGAVLELVCDVSGTPKPEFTWHKENAKIEAGDKYAFNVKGDSYSLVINVSEEKDTGLYR